LARQRKGSSRGRYKPSYARGRHNAGLQAARKHIREAEEFADEIGGAVEDVKSYFFSLPQSARDEIFAAYGKKYGSDKESYARATLPKWKTGKTKMSGLVAKRLFDLLPPRMSANKKLDLAESVWRHKGPRSSHAFRIGADANIEEVLETIAATLSAAAHDYEIPREVKARFNWLAAGDVRKYEELLNHFRSQDRELAIQRGRQQIPILQRQQRDHSNSTGRARIVLEVHRHKVSLEIDDAFDGGIEKLSRVHTITGGGASPSRTQDSGSEWGQIFFYVLVLGVLVWMCS